MSESWTKDSYPAVPPDARFRQNLQAALEQTHRQQAAQRKLGTQRPARRMLSPQRVVGVALLLLAVLLIARWWNKGRNILD